MPQDDDASVQLALQRGVPSGFPGAGKVHQVPGMMLQAGKGAEGPPRQHQGDRRSHCKWAAPSQGMTQLWSPH